MVDKQVGVLWKQKAGHLSGNISLGIFGEIKIVVFPNKYKKEGSSQPDYHIIKSRVHTRTDLGPDASLRDDFEPADIDPNNISPF